MEESNNKRSASFSKIVYEKYRKWSNEMAVGISVAGFLLVCMILAINVCTDNHLFHEIGIKPCDQLESLIHRRLDFLRNEIGSQKRQRDSILAKITKDSSRLPAGGQVFLAAEYIKHRDSMANAILIYERTQREGLGYRAFNADTSIKYLSSYLSVKAGTFADSLGSDQFKGDSSFVSVHFTSVDTVSYLRDSLAEAPVDVRLYQLPFLSKVSFFRKYPSFGYWFVIGILQFTLWFLMGTIVMGMMPGLVEGGYKISEYLKCCIVPFAVISLFVVVVYFGLIGDNVIRDQFFMNAFNTRMILYSIPGYILAGLCFGGYLFVEKLLDKLEQPKDDAGEEEKKKYNAHLIQLNRAFKFLFFLCSAILSVFIIWLGALFISLNSMDAMKYYLSISGKLFMPNDLIYMIGLVHSLLLAMFYIPVQLKFKNIVAFSTPDAPETKDGQKSGGAVLSSLFSNLSGVLITSSPLIISILQSLLNSFFGGK